MLPKFNYVVCAIEEENDIETMSIDELHSSLLVHEQKLKSQNTTIKKIALKSSTSNEFSSWKGSGHGRGRGRAREEGEVLMILAAEEIMMQTAEEILILEVVAEVNTNNKDIMSQNLTNHKLSAISVVGTVTIVLNATLTCLKKGVRHQNLNKEMKKFFLLLTIQRKNPIPIDGILTHDVAIVCVGRKNTKNCNSIGTPIKLALKLTKNPRGKKVDVGIWKVQSSLTLWLQKGYSNIYKGLRSTVFFLQEREKL
ncbi:unnamed protein product [Prunus brigantina]